jgi:hypothetical protein
MRSFRIISTCIIIGAIITVVVTWQLFSGPESARRAQVAQVQARTSYVRLMMLVDYPSGNIAHEEYNLVDDNGQSHATYKVTDRNGTTARFDDNFIGHDVSFAFGKMVQDGIWRLTSKHRRAEDEVGYTVSIEQTQDGEHGSRKVSFTNPRFWAKTSEYHITLDPKKKTPDISDILKMQSISTAQPGYLAIVNDFRDYGSPQFKSTIAAAREKLLKS